MDSVDLSVVIVNWNVCNLLKQSLKSIYENTNRGGIEIFVVDNASTDGSVEMVRKEFPEAILLANPSNIGFPRANNLALKHCRGRYILLLNPDTIISKDALDRMIDFMDTHPEVGVVGPKILNLDNTIHFDCARNFPTLLNIFFEFSRLSKHFPNHRIFGRYRMGYWDHQDSREVDCLDGSCILVRNDAIKQIGFLDEQLFMYLEDIDLCYRIRENGWKIYYLALAEIVHIGGESSKRVNEPAFSNILELEAYRLFHQTHRGKLSSIIVRIMVFILSLPAIFILSVSILLPFFGKKEKKYSNRLKRGKFIQFIKWSLNPTEVVGNLSHEMVFSTKSSLRKAFTNES